MQQITLSGTLITDASKQRDKSGRNYIRFTLTCSSVNIYGRTEFTHYRCICYVPGYESMKKGDQVFITGKFSASIGKDDKGNAYLNLDVMVTSISGGYRAAERKKE